MLPVFMMFVLAIIEFGHAQLVNNVLRNACRTGARLGATEGQSTADVEARVRQIVASAVDPGKVQIFVKNGSVYDEGGGPTEGAGIEGLTDLELSDAETRQMFVVRAKIDYDDVNIVPIPLPYVGEFLTDVTLEGQAFMRHE